MPKGTPSIVRVPKMNYIAVRGSGNPNDADGEYKQSIGLLYGIAFTIKMSKKEDHQIDGYFDYVVPPLEGFWWQEGVSGIDYARKEEFKWISVIRLPDFVSREDFDWAVRKATEEKETGISPKLSSFRMMKSVCTCMHIGSYDDEPATVDEMHRFMEEQGYALDITDQRMHHEIYLSDARRVAPEKRKTVVRHPIRRLKGMEYIRVTKENLEKEHICCAISNNKDIQVSSKKACLRIDLMKVLCFLRA